jgi:hypothetical protein
MRMEFEKNLGRSVAHSSYQSEESTELPETLIGSTTMKERWLLKVILLQDDAIDWLVEHLDPNWLPDSQLREVVARRFMTHLAGTWTGIGAFLNDFDSEPIRTLITEASTGELVQRADGTRHVQKAKLDISLDKIAESVKQIRDKFIDQKIAELSQRAEAPALSHDERVELLREQQHLRQLKRQPLLPLGEAH